MSVIKLRKIDIGRPEKQADGSYEKESKWVDSYSWFCEGCGFTHDFWMDGRWTFDGNFNQPTFSPSLLLKQEDGWKNRCHTLVKNGEVEFLLDCTHKLAGRTLELLDVENWPKVR